MFVGIDIFSIYGASILAFILGVLIGFSLGYIIWSDRQNRKNQ